ncbi:MAG: cyanophycin synthetase [Lentisphaerae bacterium GWF2_38_69]|nr:MAG: cyanophycin synthetase [Lentisphaerae bacterium GWF2_38_69]
MKLLEVRALRGANRYSLRKSILMLIGLNEEKKSSASFPGLSERLLELMPGLLNHQTAKGIFFTELLRKGTTIAHIVENVVWELQTLAGLDVKFSRTIETRLPGQSIIIVNYIVEKVGLEAAKAALDIVEDCIDGVEINLYKIIQKLKKLREEGKLGPTTQALIDEAAVRGIPYVRLNDQSFVQLGYGKYQKKIQASMTSETSALAAEIAGEKSRTKELLKNACIPVPDGEKVSTLEDALDAASAIGYPVVIKPERGNHGRGVTVNIKNEETLESAYYLARKVCSEILVESYIEGNDYRLLVVNGIFTAASHRQLPFVTGDGKSTIKELINTVNSDPLRGYGHENVLTKITIDEMTEQLLEKLNLNTSTVLEKGRKVYLKTTANLSLGGTASDVTDEVYPEIRFMAERTAKIIGLDVIGIDFLCSDISKPISSQRCGIVEVNATPGLRMHLKPSFGKPRNAAKPIIDMLFPEGTKSAMPLIAVTGTNGKTTTCKLITHSLKYAGHKVGLATTTGVEIDGLPIAMGDYSGPSGHEMVLREPTIDHAVLETARGAIVRRGLAYDKCDVGIFLNVADDHIGNDFVDTVEDLAFVKAAVVEVVKPDGTAVLNAQDDLVMDFYRRAKGNVVLFSLDENNPYIKTHLEEGNTAVTVSNKNIVIRNGANNIDSIIASVYEVPITFGGAADFNVANTLAAVAALHGLKLPNHLIRSGITTFFPSVQQNPGRMNMLDFGTFKVILDYGHNKPAIEALGAMLKKISPDGRKIGVSHGTGSRKDEVLMELGAVLSRTYDYVIIGDPDPRGRESGATPLVVQKGMIQAGFNPENIKIINDYHKAIDNALEIVQKDDLIVIQVDEGVEEPVEQIMKIMELRRK